MKIKLKYTKWALIAEVVVNPTTTLSRPRSLTNHGPLQIYENETVLL
jgi:hypothetical protein